MLANDTDIDGGSRSIQSATDPVNGSVVITGGGSGLTYQPDASFCSATPDTFLYTLNGGSSATVSVTVTCVDDGAAVANDDSRTVAEDSGASTFNVLANDSADPDDGSLTVTAVGTALNGTTSFTATGVTYTPNTNFCSATPDAFSYTVDGGDTAIVSVTVTCVDDGAAVADDDSQTLAEDSGATTFDVLANDTADPDDGSLAVTAVGAASNGTTSFTATGVTYTPNADFCSATPDTFTYTVNGGDTATVSVTVTCVDDAPVAVANTATLAEDAPATAIDVLANDTDIDGGAKSIQSATDPANGTVVITGGGAGLTYQPDANFCSTTPDTFQYTLNGGSSATVSVTVTCANDGAAVANDDSRTVAEDSGATTFDVLANDAADPDDASLAVTAVTDAPNGTTSFTAAGVTYTPDPDFCSVTPDTFTYTVNGGDTATVTVTVTCVDDGAAAANDDARTVAEDAAATTFDVLANDTADPDGAVLAVVVVTQPANGTAAIGPAGANVTFTPAADFCGATSFGYTITGGDTATVNVTVTCVNDAPVLDDRTVTITAGAANGTLLAALAALDVDSSGLSYAITGGNTGNAFSINPTSGAVTVASSAAVTGTTFTLTITVSDGTLDDTATITVNVAPGAIFADGFE